MAKKKQIVQVIFVICLFLGLSAQPIHALALKADFTSNQSTQANPIDALWESNQTIPDTYELVAENSIFQLYANEATLAFKVVDKRSGYVWHSNLDEKAEEDKLNKTWTAFASSGISIDYLDQKAISERASITNADHSIDFKRTGQGFEAAVNFTEPSITIVVIVRLEENGVSVEIPFESITEENPDYRLGMLYVYPFFGATRDDDVPGYMFIPDGSGSLIRFSAETKAKNMFYGRYYGPDLGMISTLPYDPFVKRAYKLSIPVIGMVHGEKQNAYLSIVEKGASYGEIHAHPAGIITNFNFLYNAFLYNESYFQATNRSGAGVTTLQRNTNAFDVKIQYRFLTKDASDYVGMARSYQQYLIEKGGLKKTSNQDGDIRIRLEVLGGEKEKILLWNRPIPMTTVSQLTDILNGLDILKPEVVYYGWQPYGASSMAPKSLKLDGDLGSMAELRSLVESIDAEDGNFYLYLDPQAALVDEKGYSPRYDVAMSITNNNLLGYNRHKVNYYLNFDAINERYSSLSQGVFNDLKGGLALDTIGSNLYSDFKGNDVLNRETTIQMYQDMLDENNGRTAFYMPNDYMFGYMNAYFDIPLSSSGYLYTTDVVPFLQVVLAGYVPYYGTALNFSSNIRDDILRHVDFGIYPSFFLSYDVTAKIMNTTSSWIYTSSYSQWGEEIEQTYRWLNNLLGPVSGQNIVARDVLKDGVFATTYSNGRQIIVNYNDEPFSAGNVIVQGKDAVLTEVLP